MLVTLESGQFGWDYLLVNEKDETVALIQTDWDYPGIASNLGFVPCDCGATDGTIDCAHHSAMDMIRAAQTFLDDHIGESFDYGA